MIKNLIFKKIFPVLIILFGVIYLINYLDISPETKSGKKTLSNEIVIPVR